MEDSHAAEVARETELRKWAAENKITTKAMDILVKEGFSSMEAVALLDADDLGQSKMPRGQQKLLLKALRLIHAAEAGNARGPEPGADQHNSNTAQLTADRRDGSNAGEDAYANLLTDLQTMQATETAQTGDEHQQSGQLFEPGHSFKPSSFGGSAHPAAAAIPSGMTIPCIHLMSATAGKSPLSYHVTEFLSRDTIEEVVVAGAHEGKQIVIKSALSPNSKQLLCPNGP